MSPAQPGAQERFRAVSREDSQFKWAERESGAALYITYHLAPFGLAT